MSETVQIDGMTVIIRRSPRRANVDITIERDGQIVAAVPEAIRPEALERVLRSKAVWIHTALGRKQATEKGPPPRQFVSGEGFYYLGRKYRLKLLQDADAPRLKAGVVLAQGRFFLPAALAPSGRDGFITWYTARADEWITQRCASLKDRVAAQPAAVGIRDLGYRWGSCSRGGAIHFHWKTILLPPERIDYLIVHELAHIHEHNHGPDFYDRLRRACPDFKQHEEWFRRNGDLYSL